MATIKLAPSHPVTANGVTQSIAAWAAALGVPSQTILSRLNRGWSAERAVSTPPSDTGGANRNTKHAAEVLVKGEVEQLLEAAPKTATAIRDRAMIVVAYRAGLRCCELLDLRLKDIDQSAGTIRVLHGKGNKERVVGIDAGSWAIVTEWIAKRKELVIDEAAPLFCTSSGGPISSRQVRAMMNRRAKRSGIQKHVHLHGLRHTMASEMAAEGVPLLDISGALGHSNANTTNKYLQRLSPTSVIDAMRSRGWGRSQRQVPGTITVDKPSPGWVEQLRASIGQRLFLFQDCRQSEDDFKAVVILF